MSGILIVDDEDALRRVVRRTLERAGHTAFEASNVREARELLLGEQVGLVFCDINMPGESGLELVRSLDGSDVAVVMLTGVDDPEVAAEAVAIGAYGYLVKPVAPNEVLINVASALRRRELELARREYVDELGNKLLLRSAALREAMARLERIKQGVREAEHDAVNRLVIALTIRSEETGAHMRRVGLYSALLARGAAANVWSEDEIRLAAMLHDVGKLGVPDSILTKPGPLTEEEIAIIRRHPAIGARLLAEAKSPVLALGADIALSHHERWDGTGYPRGLAEDEIPLAGRIVGVADVFDALTSDRVYRPAMSVDEAIGVMQAEGSRHFDPELLDRFVGSSPEIEEIRASYPDGPLTHSQT